MIANKVLITGGAGFIGTHTALQLEGKGYEVTILDNLSEQIHGKNAQIPQKLMGKVKFILGDVRNREGLIRAIDGQDVIIHLASETGTGQSMYEIYKYADVNISGTALLLDVLMNEKHNIKKMVLASSRAVYGEGKYSCNQCSVVYPTSRNEAAMQQGDFEVKCPHCKQNVKPLFTDEDSQMMPSSIYAITKQSQELMVLQVGRALGIATIVFRYQNVYGAGQSLSNPYTGILSIFSTRIKNGNQINIFEDGKESRDFIYIDDVVRVNIMAVEDKKINSAILNVGTGVATSVIEVATGLAKAYNKKIEYKVTGDFRIGDIRHNYADTAQIKKLLDYEAKITFEEGIKRFSTWVNSQEIESDLFEKSMKEMRDKGLLKTIDDNKHKI